MLLLLVRGVFGDVPKVAASPALAIAAVTLSLLSYRGGTSSGSSKDGKLLSVPLLSSSSKRREVSRSIPFCCIRVTCRCASLIFLNISADEAADPVIFVILLLSELLLLLLLLLLLGAPCIITRIERSAADRIECALGLER